MMPKCGAERGGKGRIDEMNVGRDLWRCGCGK
jgi:hypothetical protein